MTWRHVLQQFLAVGINHDIQPLVGIEQMHALLAQRDALSRLTEALDDALFIVEISVHQTWQGQGIGRAMMAKIMEAV